MQKKIAESKDSDGRVFVKLSELKEGSNNGKMLLLKLLISAIRTEHPPACVYSRVCAAQPSAALLMLVVVVRAQKPCHA